MRRYELGCRDYWDLYGVIANLPYGYSYPNTSDLDNLIDFELNCLSDKILKGAVAEYHIGYDVIIGIETTTIMGIVADNHTDKSKGVIKWLRERIKKMEEEGKYRHPLQFKKVKSGS